MVKYLGGFSTFRKYKEFWFKYLGGFFHIQEIPIMLVKYLRTVEEHDQIFRIKFLNFKNYDYEIYYLLYKEYIRYCFLFDKHDCLMISC